MRGVHERPAGLLYHDDLLTAAEEADVLAELGRLNYAEVRLRGQAARRTVRHFGYRYEYESWRLVPAEPLPDALAFVRRRCADIAGIAADELAETLVTRYPPGATIGWHRDAPVFGPTVLGVSLRAGCLMRFQRSLAARRYVYELALAPRSVYVLSGSARSTWQHSIPPVPELRYSVTFRTLRRRDQRPDPGTC